MTDTQSSEGNGEGTASSESKPNWRRELEARASAGDEAVARVAELERRDVFRDAGLNPSDKMTGYFMKGYDGELSVDAIKAEAAEAGIGGGGSAQSQTNPNPGLGEYDADDRIAGASDDAGPVTDPELNDLIRQTKNDEELDALMTSRGYAIDAAT